MLGTETKEQGNITSRKIDTSTELKNKNRLNLV